MFELIKQNVVYPLAGRLGSSAAGALIGYGVTQQHADWFAIGVMGASGVVFDLVSSWVRRRFVIDRTFNETLNTLFGEAKP